MTNTDLNRRQFMATAAVAGTVTFAGSCSTSSGSKGQKAPTGGFFSLDQRHGRWWLITPEGKPFFTLGINHVDFSPLLYPETIHIWRTKYKNSMKTWLQEGVRPDLLAWGLNTVGEVQDVVAKGNTLFRQSRNYTYEEYQWLDLPYFFYLDFGNFEQWERESRLPDFFSVEFAQWCDYIARVYCGRMANDPKLVGYFYIDIPAWLQTGRTDKWRGPIFDSNELKTEAGLREVHRVASRYYQVTHDAIRRYDKNHLIFGDRYNAQSREEEHVILPKELLLAAKPYVDVISLQHYGPPKQVVVDLERAARISEMPVLAAEGNGRYRLKDRSWRLDPNWSREVLELLRDVPACVGFGLCAPYLTNRNRRMGLLKEDETADQEVIAGITKHNRQTQQWVKQLTARK